MLQPGNRAMFKKKKEKRKSYSAGVLIQIHSLDKSKQSHSIQRSHPFLWEKRTASELQQRGQRFSQLRGMKRLQKWDIFHPIAAPTGSTQVKPLQWAWLIFQSRCPQYSMMSSSQKLWVPPAWLLAVWLQTAGGPAGGFLELVGSPQLPACRGFAFTYRSLASVLCFCWIVHKSGSLQFAGAV